MPSALAPSGAECSIIYIPHLVELEKHGHRLNYKHLAPTELMILTPYVELTLIMLGDAV